MVDPKRVRQAILRRDFPSFLHMCTATLSPGERFSPNWHHHAIGWRLSQIEAGANTRLIVNMPPRALKSITISVAWVAWVLGHFPAHKFVCVSYAQELAEKHHRDTRLIMDSAWYKEAFPATRLVRATQSELVTSQQGGRLATSVGGSITGLGGHTIIIDDPIKPEDAQSEILRRRCLDWFSSTMSTRLNDKAKGSIVLVMQRVHADDLAGQLLDTGDWDHLDLPAFAVEEVDVPIGLGVFHHRAIGDVLHPTRESRELLERQQRQMGSAQFSAQYQQRPVPAQGSMIQRSWLKRYDDPPTLRSGDKIILSMDTATKAGVLNDYSAGIVALVRRNDIYLLHVFRDRLLFPGLERKVIELAREHRVSVLLIEDAASGQQLIQTLQANAPSGVPAPIAIRPEGDKLSRMAGVSSIIEAGKLLLPREAPWLADFEIELLSFPHGRHDDQADALSQLLGWARQREYLPAVRPWFGDHSYDGQD